MGQSKTVSGVEMASGYAEHPNHKLSVGPASGRYLVKAGEQLIVETSAALALHEASYPVALYFARADADMALLTRTTHTTWCPFKGRAAYYSIGDDPALENAVWSYEDPFEEVGEIKDYLGFYTNKVTVTKAG